jgi:hypothetical protein
MAEDINYQEVRGRIIYNQDTSSKTLSPETSSTYNLKQNALYVGFGISSSQIQMAGKSGDNPYSAYEDIEDFNAIANFNIALLRRINNTNFSLGFDFNYFINDQYSENSYYQNGTTQSANKIEVIYSIYMF